MASVKLKAGESVIVTAMRDDVRPDNTLPGGQGGRPDQTLPTPERPVDPGYGIDLGLGYLRPDNTLPGGQGGRPDNTLPGSQPRPDQGLPGGQGGKPTHPIVLPPEGPVDPSWGIDEDIGYVRPDNTLPVPVPPTEGVPPQIQWEIKTAWTPVTGWVVVAVPTGNVPTPSK